MSGRLGNTWTPGTTYPPGSVVRPTSTLAPSASPPTNPSFDAGTLAGWTAAAGYTASTDLPYTGTYCAKLAALAGSALSIINTNQVAVALGSPSITAKCFVNFVSYSVGVSAAITLTFYASDHTTVTETISSTVATPLIIAPNSWIKLSVTAAPTLATSVYVAVGVVATNTSAHAIYLDNFSWNYLAPPATSPLLFYAVQTGTGKSGSVEPTWAATVGPAYITDGTVHWSSTSPTAITWASAALLKSAGTEPTWPTVVGQFVHEIASGAAFCDWEAITPQITDANCPHSKYVAIAASKIFALDTDIARFSATLDPTDWTTEADAGFLPTGQRSYGSNPFIAIGEYRSNLCFFNSEGMQMWQVDEDPANMALLDSIPIGCTQNRSIAPVNNDLFFLAAQGVRTMGISAGSGNLMAGDVGMPIDPLVQLAVTWAAANSVTPVGAYYPSAGQYFLAFPGWASPNGTFVNDGGSGTTTIFVYTMSRVGEVGAWSRYLVQFEVEDFCQSADTIYMRGLKGGVEQVFKFDPSATQDTHSGGNVTSSCVIQWPYLDCGQPGLTKQLQGFDTVVSMTSGSPAYTIEFGYDETSLSSFTTAYTLNGDTLPGLTYPIQLMAPTFSMRLIFDMTMGWQVQQCTLYLADAPVAK